MSWFKDLFGLKPEIELTDAEIERLKSARREAYVEERIKVERERGKELARPKKPQGGSYEF